MKKISDDYMLRTIAGERLVVPTGSAVRKFNGLLTLNEVAAFIWEALLEQKSPEEIIQGVLDEFEVEEAIAVRDVHGFIAMLEEKGILVEE